MSSGDVAPREDAAVDARVQRLDAPTEHLRELRHVLDRRHREPGLRERVGRSAARDELEAELGETPRELGHTRLVVDGDQRAHSSPTTFGRSRCSASCTRARSVSTVSSGRHGYGLARDHLARVDALVDVVDGRRCRGSTGREHVLERMRAREVGQRRRVDVDDAAREALEERRAAGGACTRRRRRARPRARRASPPSPCRARRDPRTSSSGNDSRGDARCLRRARGARAASTFDATATTGKLGVEQRLQVRSLARDEHADHARTILPITSSSPGSGTTAR